MNKADHMRNLATIEDLLYHTYKPVKPSTAQHNAIAAACAVMATQNVDKRKIEILGYHVEKPEAFIFRDKYTIAALRAGRKALTLAIKMAERWGE